MVAAASAVWTALVATLFMVRVAGETEVTVGGGTANDETLGGWAEGGTQDKK